MTTLEHSYALNSAVYYLQFKEKPTVTVLGLKKWYTRQDLASLPSPFSWSIML